MAKILKIYQLTEAEKDLIDSVNNSHRNTLMIVCDYGAGADMAIPYNDLNDVKFSEHRARLSTVLDPARIKDVLIDGLPQT